jgi:hypothetical protein
LKRGEVKNLDQIWIIQMSANLPANHLLLLGAGFSRNWGGWLANEADEYLLGHDAIDKSVRDILWQCRRKGGFEAALAILQNGNPPDDRLVRLEKALMSMFQDMDRAFQQVNFNFNNSMKDSVSTFLTRFDAIFTLNQDLLLERHYFQTDDVALKSNGKWNGYQLPGVERCDSNASSWDGIGTWQPSDKTYTVEQHAQPYFKLHGSANWRSSDSNQLLIMGGNKAGAISKSPVLQKYSTDFAARLSVPNTKLMIIGYSFGDEHINQSIKTAVKNGGLRIFIVDPQGVDVMDKNRNEKTIYSPDELVNELWPSIMGASRRSLREIFNTDRVEYDKVARFFD